MVTHSLSSVLLSASLDSISTSTSAKPVLELRTLILFSVPSMHYSQQAPLLEHSPSPGYQIGSDGSTP